MLLSVDSLVFLDTSLEVFCHLFLFKPLTCYLRCLIQFLMWCFFGVDCFFCLFQPYPDVFCPLGLISVKGVGENCKSQ